MASSDTGEAARTGEAPAGAAFRRVVLKLSGEALMGDEPYGIDPCPGVPLTRSRRHASPFSPTLTVTRRTPSWPTVDHPPISVST